MSSASPRRGPRPGRILRSVTEETDRPEEGSALEPAENESAFGEFRAVPEGTRRGRRRSKKQSQHVDPTEPDRQKKKRGQEDGTDRQKKKRKQEDGTDRQKKKRKQESKTIETAESPERSSRDKRRPRRRRERLEKPDADSPEVAPDAQESPLRSFTGRVAIVEDSSVTTVEISDASVVSSTSLPAVASPAEALAAAAKAVGRKGVVVLASKVEARSLGSDRAEDPSAARTQAAVFASEHFGPGEAAALVGVLVVKPDIDDHQDTLRALLKRGTRVVPVAGCVPSSATAAVWVRIGRSRVDMTLVADGEVHDIHSVEDLGADRYRELLDALDNESAQQQWCSNTADAIAGFPHTWTTRLTGEPEIVVSGPIMSDPNIAGRLVPLVRSRTKLRAIEAPAAMAGLAGLSPTLAEPASAHAVTAALAAVSQSRLAVSATVLGAQHRRVRRAAVAIAACWVLVWAGLGWVSQRAGLSTEQELAAVAARIAQTEAALADVEVADSFDAERARALYEALAAPGPDWGRYLRWAHATDHPLVLDRSGQSTATIQIEATSVEEILRLRITALEWLDCFARAVFDRQGFARSSSRGVQLTTPLPLTGSTGERIRLEPESAVWGVNPIDPIDGDAQSVTADAALEGPAPLIRDDGRDCGPSPPHIRGISDHSEQGT